MRGMITVMAFWLAMIGGCMAARADDAQVSVRWEFPTENVDGTPLTNLAGARVYYGVESGNYTAMIDVPGGEPGGSGSLVVTGLVDGVTYYLTGTAYNADGLESDLYEPEAVKVAKSITVSVPKAHGTFAADPAQRTVTRRILMEVVEITQEWQETFDDAGDIVGGEWVEVNDD